MVMSFLTKRMWMYDQLSGDTKIKRPMTTHLKEFERVSEEVSVKGVATDEKGLIFFFF